MPGQAEIQTCNLSITNPALYHTATSAPSRWLNSRSTVKLKLNRVKWKSERNPHRNSNHSLKQKAKVDFARLGFTAVLAWYLTQRRVRRGENREHEAHLAVPGGSQRSTFVDRAADPRG